MKRDRKEGPFNAYEEFSIDEKGNMSFFDALSQRLPENQFLTPEETWRLAELDSESNGLVDVDTVISVLGTVAPYIISNALGLGWTRVGVYLAGGGLVFMKNLWGRALTVNELDGEKSNLFYLRLALMQNCYHNIKTNKLDDVGVELYAAFGRYLDKDFSNALPSITTRSDSLKSLFFMNALGTFDPVKEMTFEQYYDNKEAHILNQFKSTDEAYTYYVFSKSLVNGITHATNLNSALVKKWMSASKDQLRIDNLFYQVAQVVLREMVNENVKMYLMISQLGNDILQITDTAVSDYQSQPVNEYTDFFVPTIIPEANYLKLYLYEYENYLKDLAIKWVGMPGDESKESWQKGTLIGPFPTLNVIMMSVSVRLFQSLQSQTPQFKAACAQIVVRSSYLHNSILLGRSFWRDRTSVARQIRLFSSQDEQLITSQSYILQGLGLIPLNVYNPNVVETGKSLGQNIYGAGYDALPKGSFWRTVITVSRKVEPLSAFIKHSPEIILFIGALSSIILFSISSPSSSTKKED